MRPPNSPEPDRSRGSDESLYRLYELVPVAEQVDIVEDWDQATDAALGDAELQQVAKETDDELVDEPAIEPVPNGADEDAGPMTQGQVLGLLEHRLGAERLGDEGPEDDS